MGLTALQSAVGNRAFHRLLRKPQPNVSQVSDRDRREFVNGTIAAFDQGAAFYADRWVVLSAATFDRVMTSWYRMIILQEKIVDADLGGDAALKGGLHRSYTAALRVLIPKAAGALGKSEDDLYRENRGRIPMWAWQTPHHMVRGITTPIAEGRTVDRSGEVSLTTNGFDVTIRPDRTVNVLEDAAKTSADFTWGGFRIRSDGAGQQLVKSFSGPGTPKVRIRTTYRRGVAPAATSAYGRGTTPEDVAGGAVTPGSLTVGFHEGSHGLDYQEFLATHPPPRFTGTVGMPKTDFDAAVSQYHRETRAYEDDLLKFVTRHGDCVGTTIDQFHQANARRGARIVLECNP